MIFIILILCILLFVIFLLSSMKRSYEHFFVLPRQSGTKLLRTADEIQREIVDKTPSPIKFYFPEKVLLIIFSFVILLVSYYAYQKIIK